MSESQHWYDEDGNPAYTTDGRPTTIRDARKANLFPSVTTIIRCAAAPQLSAWQTERVLDAAWEMPPNGGDRESWGAAIKARSRESTSRAAAIGEAIHSAVEAVFGGDGNAKAHQYSKHAMAARAELFAGAGEGEWVAERSFASKLYGYGGRVDLHRARPERPFVVDVKTKDGELPTVLYDDHLMQLAAYSEGLELAGATAGILYVERESGESRLLLADPGKLARGWRMFRALLSFWEEKNKYSAVRL